MILSAYSDRTDTVEHSDLNKSSFGSERMSVSENLKRARDCAAQADRTTDAEEEEALAEARREMVGFDNAGGGSPPPRFWQGTLMIRPTEIIFSPWVGILLGVILPLAVVLWLLWTVL